MVNKGVQGRLGATDSGMRPGCFPLGSPQSRAAARAMLESQSSGQRGMIIFSSVPRPRSNGLNIGPWIDKANGRPVRIFQIPAGMTIEEAELIVADGAEVPDGLCTKLCTTKRANCG